MSLNYVVLSESLYIFRETNHTIEMRKPYFSFMIVICSTLIGETPSIRLSTKIHTTWECVNEYLNLYGTHFVLVGNVRCD